MQPGDNLIDSAGSNHGVLSHRPGEHLQNLVESDRAPLDEADQKTNVSENGVRPRESFGRGRCSGPGDRGGRLGAPGVQEALLQFTGLVAVVGAAALVGFTPAVGLPTTERTTQIASTGIARIGEKEDPAVPTSSQAPAQPGVNTQDRSQQHAIREHQGPPGHADTTSRRTENAAGSGWKKNQALAMGTDVTEAPLALSERLTAVEVVQGESFFPDPPWLRNSV